MRPCNRALTPRRFARDQDIPARRRLLFHPGRGAPGGRPPAPPSDHALEKLVEQLGDNDYRVRDEASRALKEIGAKALPSLRKALTHPDAEVRRRANELLPALETAALLAPKRVTLKTVNKPIKDAFDELIRQTGYHVEYNLNDPNKLYSFDLQDVSFWEAVDKLSRSSGLMLQQGYGDDHVRLYPQDAYSPHVDYAGAFRFTAASFNQYRNIDFSLTGKGAAATSPQREPDVDLLGVRGAENGHSRHRRSRTSTPPTTTRRTPCSSPSTPTSLSTTSSGRRRWTAGKYGNGNRMYSTQAQVNLQRPSEQATAAKVIRGTLPVTLLVEQKEVGRHRQGAGGQGRQGPIGTTQFVIEDVTEQPGKQYQIKMAVTEDLEGDPNDYSWLNSLYQRIEVLDVKGNPMQIYQSSLEQPDGQPRRNAW